MLSQEGQKLCKQREEKVSGEFEPTNQKKGEYAQGQFPSKNISERVYHLKNEASDSSKKKVLSVKEKNSRRKTF